MTMITMRMYVASHLPFQLISGFFHVNQGVLCSEHAEQASYRGVLEGGEGGGATGLLNEGGGSNRLPV